MFQSHAILHPTDYSDCARYAFDLAVELARHQSGRLIVLHVAESLGPEFVSFGEIDIEDRLAEGDSGDAIARVAREQQCDLIVMGTDGRTALSRLLGGSVTQKVFRLASCGVCTIRMPAPVSVAAHR